MKTITESEETVQRVIGPLMPVMSHERWTEDIRPAIAKMLGDELCKARDEAQALVFRIQQRHDEEVQLLKSGYYTGRPMGDAAGHRRNGTTTRGDADGSR